MTPGSDAGRQREADVRIRALAAPAAWENMEQQAD
jgi:hypothetical protein